MFQFAKWHKVAGSIWFSRVMLWESTTPDQTNGFINRFRSPDPSDRMGPQWGKDSLRACCYMVSNRAQWSPMMCCQSIIINLVETHIYISTRHTHTSRRDVHTFTSCNTHLVLRLPIRFLILHMV